jgi:carbon monoxide dehydrogenase subunit G
LRTSVESLIDAPRDVVFASLVDIERWPDVISGIVEVTLLTPGPVAVGTRFRETREMFGRKATEEMTVAEMESPRRLVLTAFNHGTTYRVEHLLAAEGAGGTRLTVAFEGRPVTLAARLLMPLGLLFRGAVRRQLASDLADLERDARRRHRDGAPRPA